MAEQKILQTVGTRSINHMTRMYRDLAITALQLLVDDLREGPAGKNYEHALESLDDPRLFLLLEIADLSYDNFIDRVDEILAQQSQGICTAYSERRYRTHF